MRKLFILFAALFAFAACTQNEVEELSANRADVPETLTVGFEGGDTRIELNEALKTVWTEYDEVSVFYRSDINQRWQYQGETGERVGDLRCVDAGSGTPTKTTKVVIAYPYSDSYYLNTETGDIQAMLPAVQGYKVSSYGEGGNLMVSSNYYNQFSLKSVVGWLRVELTGEGQMVESITLRGNAGEQVAGELYIDTATAEATLASERGEAGEGAGGSLIFDDTMFTEVTLDCGEGVELGSEATEFYIALPPQTFAEGLTIEVNCAGYKPMTLSTESSITIERNHIVPMEAVEHDAGVILPSNELWYTATALVEPYDASAFNVAIVSNEWDETTGEGVITFDGERTTIGYMAFYKCANLTSVIIPDSVTTIGKFTFNYCDSLTSVTIPDSVTTIGEAAFQHCSNLTSVVIPNGITTIGGSAFRGCYLTSVTIPDSVTTIGEAAFSNCKSLTSVTIGNSVTTIGWEAFFACDSLTSVTIPDSVTAIGEGAFASCKSLSEFKGKFAEDEGHCLIINGALNAFAIGCGVTEYTIPNSVATIEGWVFVDCNSLTSVTIPDSVTTIRERAFGDCRNLTSVTIPDSVTTIGEWAFRCCYSLTSVTIPDSVTTIGDYAFRYCNSLTSVYCEATTPPTLGDCVFWGYDNNSNEAMLVCDIYVPAESVEAYKAAENWSEYAADIVGYNFETGEVVAISNKLFYTATALVEPNDASAFNVAIVSNEWDEVTGEGVITFDGELTTIGDYAFLGCSSLTSVTIPNSVTTIGHGAFGYCDSLAEFKGKFAADGGRCLIKDNTLIAYANASGTTYTIPDSVTTIGGRAFQDCTRLTSVTIPDSVTTIGDRAFLGCDSLTSVTIPDSVTTIGGAAFYYCSSLTSVTIPDSVTTIGINVFAECRSLTSVTIPDSVTTIGGYAFSYCNSLTSVTIPDSVTTIGDWTFSHCSSLTNVTIPDSVTTIGESAFYGCSSLTSVTIPDSVTTIEGGVFGGCINLAEFKGKFAADGGRCLIKDNTLIAYAEASGTTYTIPDSVTAIGDSAFADCRSLTSVTIPDSVTTIGNWAFAACSSLTSVTIGNSVTTIGDNAFSACSSLTSVTIGDSVTTIGNQAFDLCVRLASVYCEATTPPTLGDGAVFDYNASGRKIYVPAASVEAYKSAAGWSEYAADIVGYDFETGEVVE